MQKQSYHQDNREELVSYVKETYGIDVNEFPKSIWQIQNDMLLLTAAQEIENLEVQPSHYTFGSISNMHYYYFKPINVEEHE